MIDGASGLPIATDLVRESGGWEARRALRSIVLPEALQAGVSIGGDDLRVTPRGDVVWPAVDAGRAYYAPGKALEALEEVNRVEPVDQVRTVGDVLDLLSDARAGVIRTDDVERRWPTVPNDVLFKELREDLIEALDHVPIDADGETLLADWVTTPDYDDLWYYARRLAPRSRSEPIG